jgi:hypothetical protein
MRRRLLRRWPLPVVVKVRRAIVVTVVIEVRLGPEVSVVSRVLRVTAATRDRLPRQANKSAII